MGLALAVAVLHAVTVVLVLTGALLGLRYRGVLLVHVPVAAAVAAVHVAGADCPLTTWERTLRARVGQPYHGGFLDHYVFGPLGVDAAAPAVQLAVYAVVVLPNVLGYGLLAIRGRRLPYRPGVAEAGGEARSETPHEAAGRHQAAQSPAGRGWKSGQRTSRPGNSTDSARQRHSRARETSSLGQLFRSASASITRMPLGPRT